MSLPSQINFPKERRDVLAAIESKHFWFKPRDTLLQLVLKRIAPCPNSIIELGCGTGRFLSGLQTSADLIVGVDACESFIQTASSRQTNVTFLCSDACAVPFKDATFDVAISMDVLEHVDPHLFLSEARRLVDKGGWLLLSVPSSLHLWSEADQKSGHRCRYTLKILSDELKTNGWKLIGFTHYQFLLYPLMWISRVFLKGKSSVEKHPPALLNGILGLINALEVKTFSACSLPLGSSLIAWAQKI